MQQLDLEYDWEAWAAAFEFNRIAESILGPEQEDKTMLFCTNEIIAQIALDCAQGSYQRAFAQGKKRASGSDCGPQWPTGYRNSRESMIARMVDRGVYIDECYIGRGRLVFIAAIDEADADSISVEALEGAWPK